MENLEFEPRNPILRLVADELGGEVEIDETQYLTSYDPDKKTISVRKASAWFKRGLAVWRKGKAVLTEKGMLKADKVSFAA